MQVNKLKGKIVESGKTLEYVASAIGIDRSTFYRKLKAHGNTFTVEEMNKMVQEIPLTTEEAKEIFLDF